MITIPNFWDYRIRLMADRYFKSSIGSIFSIGLKCLFKRAFNLLNILNLSKLLNKSFTNAKSLAVDIAEK